MKEIIEELVELIESAIKAKDWKVDGACDPTMALVRAKKAIAKAEKQEPVATVTSETGADITMSWWHEPALPIGTKLYTHPQSKREWVGLTGEQICDCWNLNGEQFYKNIEAKLKELNT